MNQEQIGKFIASLRKEKGLTQEELASKLAVSTNAVSKWERGLCLMDISLLIPLSEILEVSIIEILTGKRLTTQEAENISNNVIKETIDYSSKEIKKARKKIPILILLLLFSMAIGGFIYIKSIHDNENIKIESGYNIVELKVDNVKDSIKAYDYVSVKVDNQILMDHVQVIKIKDNNYAIALPQQYFLNLYKLTFVNVDFTISKSKKGDFIINEKLLQKLVGENTVDVKDESIIESN